MRVIIMRPGNVPQTCEIGEHYTDLQRALDDDKSGPRIFAAAMRGDNVIVWCDDSYLMRDDARTALNLRRATDGHPICGTVVVTSTKWERDGEANASLSDEEVTLWMYLLVLMGTAVPGDRARMLRELRDELRADQIPTARVIEALVARWEPLADGEFEPRFEFVPIDPDPSTV
jgi:hypothetical protein